MNKTILKEKKNVLITILSMMLLVIIASVVLVKSAESGRGYRTIKIVEVSGNVGVVKDGMEYRAYEGMLLTEGHVIVTGANSYVRMILDDSKYIKLEEGSRLIFSKLGMFGSNKTNLRLERGAITSEIVKPLGIGEEFVVNTPNAVLAVRGTFFRVELDNKEGGDLKANVTTYGGTVASKRVLPTGEVVNEDVLIGAGYKTVINQTVEDTVYEVEDIEGAIDPDGDGVLKIAPVKIEEINDDDLVDIYFAADNGHELFVTASEAKEKIEEREIDLENKVSVYDKAKEVEQSENDKDIIVDDSKDLIKNEETKNNNPSGIISDGVNKETNDETDGEHIHNWSDWNLMIEPDCYNDGYKERTCEDCREVESMVVEKLDHWFTDWREEDTFIDRWCMACGYREVIDKIQEDHVCEWGSGWIVTSEPTCKTYGYKERTCIICGRKEEESIKNTGHKYDENTLEIREYPQCEMSGVGYIECIVCHEGEEREISPLGHDFETEFTIDDEATCDSTGHKSRHCTRCEEFTDYTLIPASGHEVPSWTVISEGNCQEPGAKQGICDKCGEVCTETFTGSHSFEEVTIEPTEYEVGQIKEVCVHCGAFSIVGEIVPLTSTFFPDQIFREFVSTEFDYNGDGKLMPEETNVVENMVLPGTKTVDGGIKDISGIKYFKNIRELKLSYNAGLESADLTEMYYLYALEIEGMTNLTELDLRFTENINMIAIDDPTSNESKPLKVYISEVMFSTYLSFSSLGTNFCVDIIQGYWR